MSSASTPSVSSSRYASPPSVRRIRDWQSASPTDHFVQFYRTDDYLIECLAGFIAEGLWRREQTIVIATAEHRITLEMRLRQKGVDLIAATVRGQFLVLDARDMLNQFMVDGRPDPVAFDRLVISLIKNATADGQRLRAFGEMVALLWADGRRAAAIELEQLWNGAARRHEFALFCAYPASCAEASGDGPGAAHICDAHSCVITFAE